MLEYEPVWYRVVGLLDLEFGGFCFVIFGIFGIFCNFWDFFCNFWDFLFDHKKYFIFCDQKIVNFLFDHKKF